MADSVVDGEGLGELRRRAAAQTLTPAVDVFLFLGTEAAGERELPPAQGRQRLAVGLDRGELTGEDLVQDRDVRLLVGDPSVVAATRGEAGEQAGGDRTEDEGAAHGPAAHDSVR